MGLFDKYLKFIPPVLVTLAFLVWVTIFHGLYPLPFYSYFFDPELAYYLNSLQLGNWGEVQLYQHPGTILQLAGAGIAAVLQLSPEAAFADHQIDQFRLVWKAIAVGAMVLLVVQIFRLSFSGRTITTFSIAILLLISDYNTWAYWGTFTPEGGILVIYLPAALVFASRMFQPTIRPVEWIAWGAVLALITTLKITLWPVTLFLWIIAATRHDLGSVRRLAIFAVGFCGIFLLSVIAASIFAQNRADQLSWFVNLISESGRYGVRGEIPSRSFLPMAEILSLLKSGLALQNYTTLLPMLFMTALAVCDMISPNRLKTDRILAGGFILTFILTWVVFAKHPYQIKYLLVQLPLMLAYWIIRQHRIVEVLPPRICYTAMCLLAGVGFSAFANYKALHNYTTTHTISARQEIDWVIAQVKPEQIALTLWTPHPLAAKAFALRECLIFERIHHDTVRKSFSFSERTANHVHATGSSLPLHTIEPGTLIVTSRFFKDQRAPLIHLNADLQLFFYRSSPIANPQGTAD